MPTISTAGMVPFEAGITMGQIEAEQEAYRRGIEKAKQAMAAAQLNSQNWANWQAQRNARLSQKEGQPSTHIGVSGDVTSGSAPRHYGVSGEQKTAFGGQSNVNLIPGVSPLYTNPQLQKQALIPGYSPIQTQGTKITAQPAANRMDVVGRTSGQAQGVTTTTRRESAKDPILQQMAEDIKKINKVAPEYRPLYVQRLEEERKSQKDLEQSIATLTAKEELKGDGISDFAAKEQIKADIEIAKKAGTTKEDKKKAYMEALLKMEQHLIRVDPGKGESRKHWYSPSGSPDAKKLREEAKKVLAQDFGMEEPGGTPSKSLKASSIASVPSEMKTKLASSIFKTVKAEKKKELRDIVGFVYANMETGDVQRFNEELSKLIANDKSGRSAIQLFIEFKKDLETY